MYEISQSRIGSVQDHLKMFRTSNAVENVILVTTKWKEVEPAVGKEREEEISQQYWKELDIKRFQDTRASAWTIIERILAKNPNVSLPIKEEFDELLRHTSKPKKSRIPWPRFLRNIFKFVRSALICIFLLLTLISARTWELTMEF